MRDRSRAFEHFGRPRSASEQRGYALIGRWILEKRLRAGLTQIRLEGLTAIDQTVISRIENGKQYGMSWRRFATLVGVLDEHDPLGRRPLRPW